MTADISGSRILITGGSGFIGTNAVQHFAQSSCDVVNVDVAYPRNAAHKKFYSRCDILDSIRLTEIFRSFRPDFVLHLAARTDLDERKSVSGYAANIEGVSNVLEAVESSGSVRRMVVASSRMVCNIGYTPKSELDFCPPNLYGESKVQTELRVREANAAFEWIIVRPTSIWGPWFRAPYRTFFSTIERGLFVFPRDRDIQKSFGYVGNTVLQLEKLLTTDDRRVLGTVLYQCDYPPLNIRNWADLIRREMDLAPIRAAPVSLLRIVARIGDVLEKLQLGKAPLTSFRLDNLLTPMIYPTQLLEEICGRLPISLSEGVATTIEWMRHNETSSHN